MALVCGLFVTIALGVAAYFAYKTRSKIWRHGKPNIYWEEPPILRIDRSQNSQNWVSSSVAAQIYWGHCYWHSNVLAYTYIQYVQTRKSLHLLQKQISTVVTLWNIVTIKWLFVLSYLKSYLIPVLAKLNFQHHYSILQCHTILQKSI